MINASDVFKQKLQDGEKVWQEVEITFPDGTVKIVKDEIMGENCTFSDCAESSSFPIGCVVCKSMTLELDNTSDQWKNYNFYMAKVHAYLKMQTSVASPAATDELLDESHEPILDQSGGTILTTKAATEDRIENIDKGVYTITTPEQYGELLSFTALDDMYKVNATYTSKLALPQTIISLVRDACDTLSIPFGGTMQHGNLIISEIPENMTFRQLFGWAAMLETANARLDNRGYLQFIRWDFSNVQEDYSAVVDADGNVIFKGGANIDSENFISPTGNWTIDSDGFLTLIESATDASEKLKDFFTSPTVSSDDIIITGIKLKNRENEAMYGSTGYVLELENDLVADSDLETVAAQIGDSIIGAKFRNMSGELAYNPLIEFGDMAYTYDRRWNRYITPLTDVSCSVNGKTTVKTQADDPIRGMSKFVSDGTKAIAEARRLVKKERSAREEAVKMLEDTLKESSGLYETSVTQEDGSTITYLHDKPTLAESKNVIKFTAEAIGVSNDGGKTYPFGFQLTGTMIAKLLYAEGINADFINAGALTIKDGQGNIIFSVNMDTNSVYINPEYLMIGDVSLSDKIKELDENVAAAKNMTMTLSNEYQAISTDENGNIPGEFPQVQTTAQVMYGTMDVTDDCSYTITESENVTGIWNKATHTYTVSEVTADNVWVDIKAVYLNAITITKRFSVSKQKSGTPGRTYVLESSTTILKRESENSITPNVVIFSAHYRDGENAGRRNYSGRFVIEETSDGKTWETAYSSVVDETSVNYYVDYIFADSDGILIADSDGSLIGARSKDIVGLRCSLYASGGTTNLIDTVKLDVITEVTALTQEDILKLLTNDGEWKGIYKGADGELYISFSAAMGGLLKLGGKNNGNGVQKVYDSDGNLISTQDINGYSLYNADGLIKASINKDSIRLYNTPLNPNATSTSSYEGIELTGYGFYRISGSYFFDDNGELLIGIESGNEPFVSLSEADEGNIDGSFDNLFASVFEALDATIDNVTIKSGTASLKKLSLPNIATGSGLYYLWVAGDGTVCRQSSSSERYKDIGNVITPSEIEEWYKIETIWAKYKDGYLMEGDENEGRYLPMFIAENVGEHFPEAVMHVNGQVEDWNYRIMIPAMFAMLKQQKSEIDNLKEDIKELRKIIKEMRGE
nr:MAG TPA: Receptor recognition protein, Long tail, Helical sandwich, Tail fiber [Bacteriophage sp.]